MDSISSAVPTFLPPPQPDDRMLVNITLGQSNSSGIAEQHTFWYNQNEANARRTFDREQERAMWARTIIDEIGPSSDSVRRAWDAAAVTYHQRPVPPGRGLLEQMEQFTDDVNHVATPNPSHYITYTGLNGMNEFDRVMREHFNDYTTTGYSTYRTRESFISEDPEQPIKTKRVPFSFLTSIKLTPNAGN